jgi:hypothetical protein
LEQAAVCRAPTTPARQIDPNARAREILLSLNMPVVDRHLETGDAIFLFATMTSASEQMSCQDEIEAPAGDFTEGTLHFRSRSKRCYLA